LAGRSPPIQGALVTKAKRSLGEYLRENFYITASGNLDVITLDHMQREVGADHVRYSVDYPFEDMVEARDWFEQAGMSEPDRLKIARRNAQGLFRL